MGTHVTVGEESVQVSGTSICRELDANIGRARANGDPWLFCICPLVTSNQE